MPTGVVKGGCHSIDMSQKMIAERIRNFHEYFTKLHARHATLIENMINVDQTPVWWNDLSRQQKTITTKGTRKVLVQQLQHNANPREKVSVILACTRDGRKLPPAIIVKTDKTHLKRARIKLVNGVLVFLNPRTSMANSDIMQRWIRLMLPTSAGDDDDHHHDHGHRHNLLIMDSFRGHLTDEVKQACVETNTLQAVIPGGLTSYLQPLDLTVNRSFKAHLRREYMNMLQCSPGDTVDMRQTPMQRLHVLAGAVRKCWNRVESNVIRNGFKVMMRSMRHESRMHHK
jgi:hypothetical protein